MQQYASLQKKEGEMGFTLNKEAEMVFTLNKNSLYTYVRMRIYNKE